MKTNAVAVAHALRTLQQRQHALNYEKILADAYARVVTAGQTVIDIGAHDGLHTASFLKLVGDGGRVIAFEPQPEKIKFLRQRFGAMANIDIRQKALSNQTGELEFNLVTNALEESGLRQRHYNIPNPVIQKIRVAVDTLDAQCAALDRVDYIKIDIEGAEIDCLEGATALLERHRPIVSVEYGRPAYSAYDKEAPALFRLSARRGFVTSDLFGNLITTEEEWMAVCDVAYWDYFLVPQERVGAWRAAFA